MRYRIDDAEIKLDEEEEDEQDENQRCACNQSRGS